MDYLKYLSSISFRLLQPDTNVEPGGFFGARRNDGSAVKLLDLPSALLDVTNTVLPTSNDRKAALRRMCEMPRMSTIGISAMLNEAVARMSPGNAFVNVGVWHGFTFLSGIAGNSGKRCFGIDNFSEFHGSEEAFRSRFEAVRGDNHTFHAMDYREYFSKIHDQPIGVYLYDGNHSYENQLEGLRVAEPFFADDCVIFVDDANVPEAVEATKDFVAQSSRPYEILMEEKTAINAHPTWWNGIMVLRAGNASGGPARAPRRQPSGVSEGAPSPGAAADRSEPPLVSVIVHREHGESPDAGTLSTTVESALSQTWPAIEVLVADEGLVADPSLQSELHAYEGRVAVIRAIEVGTPALGAAISASRGDYVAVVAAGTKLREYDVHMGLGFPARMRVWAHPGLPWYADLERMIRAAEELMTAARTTSAIIVSEDADIPRTLTSRLRTLPYPLQGGHPIDDEHAIRDLETLRGRDAGLIAFLWPAFWWLDHYSRFEEHLTRRYRCVLRNERVVAFDLSA